MKTITTITTATRTFIWKPYIPHLPSERLYCNTLNIGWARPALGMKGTAQQYEWACLLPGLKIEVSEGKCDTNDAAKEACFKIAKRWFELTDTNRGA